MCFYMTRTRWWQLKNSWNVHPENWGRWSNLTSIFFKWVGSTTNQNGGLWKSDGTHSRSQMLVVWQFFSCPKNQPGSQQKTDGLEIPNHLFLRVQWVLGYLKVPFLLVAKLCNDVCVVITLSWQWIYRIFTGICFLCLLMILRCYLPWFYGELGTFKQGDDVEKLMSLTAPSLHGDENHQITTSARYMGCVWTPAMEFVKVSIWNLVGSSAHVVGITKLPSLKNDSPHLKIINRQPPQ